MGCKVIWNWDLNEIDCKLKNLLSGMDFNGKRIGKESTEIDLQSIRSQLGLDFHIRIV